MLESRDKVEKECTTSHRELASLNNRAAQASQKEKTARVQLDQLLQDLKDAKLQETQAEEEIHEKEVMIQGKQHEIALAGDKLRQMASTLTALGDSINDVTSRYDLPTMVVKEI